MAGVGGVVLAAGRSTRLDGDRPKQLLEIDGEPMIRRVVRAALGSDLAEVVVVLGHRAEDVGAVLGDLGVKTVENPDHADGQSTSVRAGIAALSPSVAAAMFLPADQPRLTSATIDRLVAAWAASPGAVVVPVNGGRRGSPVTFGRELFSELEGLCGDTGGRSILPRHEDRIVAVEVEDPAELADVDTAEDFHRVRDENA
jgi:molybdenum cofactor cytidylyltransferase